MPEPVVQVKRSGALVQRMNQQARTPVFCATPMARFTASCSSAAPSLMPCAWLSTASRPSTSTGTGSGHVATYPAGRLLVRYRTRSQCVKTTHPIRCVNDHKGSARAAELIVHRAPLEPVVQNVFTARKITQHVPGRKRLRRG
jgi:hypothetical protein